MSEPMTGAIAVAPRGIPTTMLAVIKERPGPGATLREVPVPQPGPGELLVRVEAASVCGTDLHIFRWDPWAEENFRTTPMVFGHETGGVVVARGDASPGVSVDAGARGPRIEVGQLVGVETHIVDWTCYQCRTGRHHVCRNLRILGVHVPGSFAEYVVVPEVNAWPSDGLSAEVAALQEPMGNAVHAMFVEEVAGQTVAVLGAGPIGLMAIGIARLAGAARVFATDVNPERLALASRMGAGVTIDARDDVVARLRSETGGNGVDVVLEMSGAAAAIHQGFAAVTNGGRISLLGIPPGPLPIDLSREVIFKGVRVYGITGRRMFETWYRTRALLDEGFDPTPIVSHRLPLAHFAEAFDLVASGHAAKVILQPNSPVDPSPGI